MKKILVGMSGGVDSSAAALLLLRQGYKVCGCTLRLINSASGAEDAKSVCDKLGIEHLVFDLRELFREKVIDNFAESYIRGETPNPCICCNKFIKFGRMLERALDLGFDGIATGHYADVRFDEKSGRYLLIRPANRRKDQTYVLYGMTQFQLARTVFPLCGLEKADIRRLAEESGLANAHKPDSQDICFVPDGNYADFIERYASAAFPDGDFTDTSGNVIGRHKGLIRYTVGQRRGLGTAFGKPVYVCGKNAADNTVILGDEKDLFRSELTLADVNLIPEEKLDEPLNVTAKIRYSAKEQEAVIFPAENGTVKIKFSSPVRAPAPGQACVFYRGDIVVGGGKII